MTENSEILELLKLTVQEAIFRNFLNSDRKYIYHDIIDEINKVKVLKIWHYDKSKKIDIKMDYISKRPGSKTTNLSEIPRLYLLNPEIIVTLQLEEFDQWQMVFTLNCDELYSRCFYNDREFFEDILLSAIKNGWDYRPYMPESRSKKELVKQVNMLAETLANLI